MQVVRMAREAGLVKMGTVAVDGTKMRANASKRKAMSYERMKKQETELGEQIRDLVNRARTIDEEEDQRYGKDRRGDELPEGFGDAQEAIGHDPGGNEAARRASNGCGPGSGTGIGRRQTGQR